MTNVIFPTIAGLLLLQFGLAANVSRLRRKTRVSIGGDTDPGDPLYKARVAHSNASEFIPGLCLVMVCLQLTGGVAGVEWACTGTLVARILHALGMIVPARMNKPNPMRVLGAGGSYLLGGILATRLLWHTL